MSVIFSRAPLRISLGGGGTDLPSYYKEHGGFLVAGAINKYVYMLTHTVFQRRYLMKYAQTEVVDEPAQIQHPILREALLRYWRGNPLEIASVADVPAGTGMGSSGAFAVCLLKALAQARSTSITPGALAEAACEIEIDVLEEPVGKQDPYVAAHGGICSYTFNPDGGADVVPLELAPETLRRLRDHLLLFYTGEARAASAVLGDQDERSRRGEEQMLANLHATKEMGLRCRDLLLAGDVEGYAELMHEHWQNKRRRSPGMTSERIDELYTLARRSGAIGGKLVGAGGGGFLLVYATHPGDTRQAMAAAGAPELVFDFEFGGGARERVRVTRRGIRVGIAGCGLVGRKRAEALGEDDELVGCTDKVNEAAAALARDHGGRVCADLDELIALGPDVVIVATSHDGLAPASERALAAGAHVLVEKPAGLGTTDIDRLGEAAARASRLVKVGFNHRFHPALERVAEEVHSGRHGDLLYVRARYGHGGRPGYDREWRADPARSGGGELIDQGMHLLDLAHWLAGPLPLRAALLRTHFWDTPVEDNAALLLGVAEDRTAPWALLHVSWTDWKNTFSLEVCCRTAKLQVDGLVRSYGPQKLRIYRMKPELGPPDVEVFEFGEEDVSWRAEWEHFTAAIADGRPLLGGLGDARYAWKRVEEAYAAGPYAAMRAAVPG